MRGDEERQQGELAAGSDLEEQDDRSRDEHHPDDARLACRQGFDGLGRRPAAVRVGVTAEDEDDEGGAQQRQHRRPVQDGVNRQVVDQLPSGPRAERLADDPHRRQQRQTRALIPRRQVGAEERAADRPHRHHHSGREQVRDRDQEYRIRAREEHDPSRVQDQRDDHRWQVSDPVREHAPDPFEKKHAEAEHRKRDADLGRARAQLPQLERDGDQHHSRRECREDERGDQGAAAAADQRLGDGSSLIRRILHLGERHRLVRFEPPEKGRYVGSGGRRHV